MEKVRVIVYGVGRVGGIAVRIMANRKWIELAGAVDSDKSKVGRDLGEVSGLDRKLGVAISDDPQAVFQKARARVVLHTTTLLDPEATQSQILQCLEAGLHVISTTEWRLIYPWVRHPQWGKRVDELAKKKGVVFLETGLNPGFISDLVPILYSGACASVKKVTVKIRGDIYNPNPRSVAYLGFGLGVEEFKKGAASGTLHSALITSYPPQLDIIADALGCKLDEVTRTVEPILAKQRVTLSHGYIVEPGRVYGFRAIHSGVKNNEAVIVMDRLVRINMEQELFEVEILIEGEPNIQVVTKGLESGLCTPARAVNYIPQVLAARPGLVTIRELPVAAALE